MSKVQRLSSNGVHYKRLIVEVEDIFNQMMIQSTHLLKDKEVHKRTVMVVANYNEYMALRYMGMAGQILSLYIVIYNKKFGEFGKI